MSIKSFNGQYLGKIKISLQDSFKVTHRFDWLIDK